MNSRQEEQRRQLTGEARDEPGEREEVEGEEPRTDGEGDPEETDDQRPIHAKAVVWQVGPTLARSWHAAKVDRGALPVKDALWHESWLRMRRAKM